MSAGGKTLLRTSLVLGTVMAIAGAGRAAEASGPPAKSPAYGRPAGLAQGGAFIDLILPIPVDGGLETHCWGGDNVKPRVVSNGIEDPQWSYWCASPLRGPDGKEHLFTVRWPQNKGHKYWVRSELVHAVADQPAGPFTVVEDLGPGHNAEAYRTRDGTYVVSVSGMDYRSMDILGPWQKVKPQFDVTEPSMSNKTFAQREDGSFLLVMRSGTVWLSEDGLKPYRRIVPTSIYPFALARGSTAFEDPVLWRDEVQYHLIVNNWPMCTAFYGRSPDGLHWTWDPGKAFDNEVVHHPDGTLERWNKIERPKVRRDRFGRATHMNLAVIDCPKEQCDGTTSSSSKSVVVPLVVGRRLAILNDKPITVDTKAIKLEIRAEPGFDPQSEVDVKSLAFGAPEVVNFGKGCRTLSAEKSGTNLVVMFDGTGHGLKSSDFVAKLLGKTVRGDLLFGYARLPGQAPHRPLLVARMPQLARRADGALDIAVPLENVGLVASTAPVPVKLALREPKQGQTPGRELQSCLVTGPALRTYGSVNVELRVMADRAAPGTLCDVDVMIDAEAPGAETFSFKKLVMP